MPLVYQQNINAETRIGVWHIAEPESFFSNQVPVQREITHPHKRLQHLAGRLLLRELYPEFPVELIRVADTRKPFLADDPFHFSISHCGDYAAAMVSTAYRVGVDVELKNGRIDRIMHKFLSKEEQFLLPRGAIKETATLLWSAKESVYKWDGEGAVDFIGDIRVQKITGDHNQGTIPVLFRDDLSLVVHYLHFNDNYLTWVFTGQ